MPTEIFNTEASLNQPSSRNQQLPMASTSIQQEISVSDQIRESKKKKIENGIDKGTMKFFKILKLNFFTLAAFFVGITLVLYNIISLKYIILSFGIYDMLLIFNLFRKTKSEIRKEKSQNSENVTTSSNSAKSKKVFKRLLTNTVFFDCMGRGLTCASFFLVEIVPGLFYSLCIGPIAICTVWISCVNVFKACKNNGETLSKILTIVLRMFFVLQVSNIFLKMDEVIGSAWNEIFWPFWIVFSIMIGLSFTIVLIFFTKLCSLLCVETDKSEGKTFFYF